MADVWNEIRADLLIPVSDRISAAKLFSRAVHMVEIECFSYCNRRCWFCPNTYIDRISENKIMDPRLYSSILDQLKSIGYDGVISYSRYNEPLADTIILDRIREARQKLPFCTLHTNTNGDYLNKEYLCNLSLSGLDSMNIQSYLKNDERYDHDRVKKRLIQTIEKLGLEASLAREERGVWLEYHAAFRGIKIRLYGRNFQINGTNRGATEVVNNTAIRTEPCLVPFYNVYIDFNGKIMPCCNLRSDIEEHRECEIGDLTAENDLFLSFSGLKASTFRKSIFNEREKAGVCKNCSYMKEAVNPDRREIMDKLTRAASHPEQINVEPAPVSETIRRFLRRRVARQFKRLVSVLKNVESNESL